jgi:hypothetical protein
MGTLHHTIVISIKSRNSFVLFKMEKITLFKKEMLIGGLE